MVGLEDNFHFYVQWQTDHKVLEKNQNRMDVVVRKRQEDQNYKINL